MAAKPSDLELKGVACGPRRTDPVVPSPKSRVSLNDAPLQLTVHRQGLSRRGPIRLASMWGQNVVGPLYPEGGPATFISLRLAASNAA